MRGAAYLQEHDKQAGQARMQQCQEVLMQLDAHISATARSPPPPEIGAPVDPPPGLQMPSDCSPRLQASL